MTNKQIAGLFSEMAGLMELHGENEFKIKSYANAYLNIRKLDAELELLSPEELQAFKGVGKTIAEKIIEISQKASFAALEEMRSKTPEGVRQMLAIKGIGPKKLIFFWKELGIESPGELLYACKENRLIAHKGFGPKIQEDLIKALEFHQSQSHLFHHYLLETEIQEILQEVGQLNPNIQIELTGTAKRWVPILESLEFIVSGPITNVPENLSLQTSDIEKSKGLWKGNIPVHFFYQSFPLSAKNSLMLTGGSEEFIHFIKPYDRPLENSASEELFFKEIGHPFVPAECRDLKEFENFDPSKLIRDEDIKGVIHNHSTYSDGVCSLKEMAKECIRLGYEYLVISDHSKTAGYANGLSIERVEMQWREIDQLNIELAPFKIYKSIESDILSDGSLDYPDEILAGFDLVIASIHSNLKMNEEKAMMRLLNAVANPYTRILGHPTGRLLLSRQGYPVDHMRLIDACADHDVVIELNANPMRLDLDWNWIDYAQKKGIKIAINPDAHNLTGIRDIKYGVRAARKGGLLRNNCLNILNNAEFNAWILTKK
ncbi:MAG: DNA polymerase/3'-5' exonuclease PolX [Saprospiraceae bacterium]|nr:DNA polymerase/3'-5' exonuclease PolX [Saprospiraceae bacterium]